MRLLQEIADSLKGVWAITHFDETGFRRFSGDVGGCLRSFQVILWLAPLQALNIWLGLPELEKGTDVDLFVNLQALAYLISWLPFPLLLLALRRHYGYAGRLSTYIAAANWFQLVETSLLTLISILKRLAVIDDGTVVVLGLITFMAMMTYEWFMLRRCLGTERSTTFLLLVASALMLDAIYLVPFVLTAPPA